MPQKQAHDKKKGSSKPAPNRKLSSRSPQQLTLLVPPPKNKRSPRNASPEPTSRRGRDRGGGSKLSRAVDARNLTAESETQSRSGLRSKSRKISRKVSVSIKRNRNGEQMNSHNVSGGSDSDNADTEPIYRLRGVLEELERKVLQKYKAEFEEA